MKSNLNVGLKLFWVAAMLLTIYCLPLFLPGTEGVALAFALPLAGKKAEEEEEDEDEDPDVKALLAKVRTAAKKEVSMHVKAINADGEEKVRAIVEKKMEVFKDVPIDKLKKAVDDMEAANAAIAELKAAGQSSAEKSKESFFQKKLKEAYPDIVKAFKNGQKSFAFQIAETKAPDLVNSASFGDRVIFGFREAGVSFAALPELFILDLIQVMSGGPGSNPLSWIERNVHTQAGPPAIVANPTPVAESATKPQLGYQWVEGKISAETIAAIVPVTKQAVYNYPMLEQEIRFELVRRLAGVLQTQIIGGSGVSPNLKGINTYATTFAAGGFALGVQLANEFDVLVAAATQVLQANFVPTAALVSHLSKGQMSMAKTADGVYAMPPFVTNGGLEVYGMKIIGTNEMATDQFLVGDFTKSLFNWVENITIEIGMIDDDFAKNQWRIRGELQGMHRIKTHEQTAFVKGDFSVAKAAMETA
jgi:chromatin segregation and condensation protein Rec8/ScpA/Scc1 (kleisin family)